MSLNSRTVAAIAFTFFSAGSAFADANHHGNQSGDGPRTPSDPETGMAGQMYDASMTDPAQMEIHHAMMQAMMQMHANMDSSSMMGSASVERLMPFPMVDSVMMNEFDADGDRLISNEEAYGKLQSMHGQADDDNDGLLTFGEFTPIYAMVMREVIVDQFQVLDADGDGAISGNEMTASADRVGANIDTAMSRN